MTFLLNKSNWFLCKSRFLSHIHSKIWHPDGFIDASAFPIILKLFISHQVAQKIPNDTYDCIFFTFSLSATFFQFLGEFHPIFRNITSFTGVLVTGLLRKVWFLCLDVSTGSFREFLLGFSVDCSDLEIGLDILIVGFYEGANWRQ